MKTIIATCVLVGAAIPGPTQPDSWQIQTPDKELHSVGSDKCLELPPGSSITFQLIPITDSVPNLTNPTPTVTWQWDISADLNKDGTVSFADFGALSLIPASEQAAMFDALSRQFGTCNNGVEIVPC